MMKKLESELMSIAHKILKLKGKEDVNKMHTEVAALYEKLTVLKFAQENFEDDLPTIGNNSSFFGMLDTAFNNTVSDTIEVGNKTYIDVDERDEDEIMEPVMEKIKDMVAQMPHETQEVDAVFEAIKPKYHKNDFEDILENHLTGTEALSAILGMQELSQKGFSVNNLDSKIAEYKSANPNDNSLESIEFESAKAFYFDLNYKQSIQSLSNFIEEYPNSSYLPEAKYYIADAYYRSDSIEEALDVFNT